MDEREQVKEFGKEVEDFVKTGDASHKLAEKLFTELLKLEGKTDVESRIKALELGVSQLAMSSISTQSQIVKSFDVTLNTVFKLSAIVDKLSNQVVRLSNNDEKIKNEMKQMNGELVSYKQQVLETLEPIKQSFEKQKNLLKGNDDIYK